MRRLFADMGRPSDYTPELAVLICSRMADGESLRSVCRDEEMPDKATVFRWLAAHKDFCDQYARALDARTDAMAEEIIEIADDDSDDAVTDPETGNTRQNTEFVARSKLRVDTRKWLMARMAPKKYGDRVENVLTGDPDKPVAITKIELVAAPFKLNPEGPGS